MPGEDPFFAAARQRLDRLLQLEIGRLRARYQLSLDELRGLYITDEQVDRLLGDNPAARVHSGDAATLLSDADRLAKESARALRHSPRWSHVVGEFGLHPFEVDVLVLAAASEIDRKYQTIYAYLNDDVAKKWPTRDLALRLFAPGWPPNASARAALSCESTLLASGLLQPTGCPSECPSWLTAGFIASTPLMHYLLGVPALGGKRSPAMGTEWPTMDWEETGIAADARAAMERIPQLGGGSLVVLHGAPGSGRRRAAAALAYALGAPLVTIDARLLRPTAETLFDHVRLALLHQRLRGAVIHIAGADTLMERESAVASDVRSVIALLATTPGIVLLSMMPETRWRDLFSGTRVRCVSIPFTVPEIDERSRIWRDLHVDSPELVEPLDALAERFSFTRGQIERTSAASRDTWMLSGRNGDGPDAAALFDAARIESRAQLAALGPLATRTSTTASWNDLVLPSSTMQQLRELANAIRFRHVVYDTWGLASKNSGARGIRALLSGASGTGKSTCAAIIANKELGVDLYTVDLSAITSKYIGETEKHLDRIFAAARSSSAVLFFDEADALFGKRSEVKDAHDRYANIEVAYLLQKVDQHDGTILLATNLAGNLDQGFSRRMHYVIEFPLPGAADRERIWRTMFPAAVPLAPDVDFHFLAHQFSIAGGDIRNVALSAAFLAAAAGRAISMRDLVRSMARQMTKQGRSPSIVDFREYLPLLHGTT